MICKKCGAKIQKGSFFCDVCGQSIGTVAELEEFNNQERRKKNQRKALLLVILLVVTVGGYAAYRATHDMSLVDLPSRSDILTSDTSESIIDADSEVIIADEEVTATVEPTAQDVQAVMPTEAPSEIIPEPTVAPTAKPQPTLKPAPTVVPVSTVPNEVSNVQVTSDYVYPSDTTVLTDEFLNSLTRAEARLVRNELYARRGLSFKSADLRQYFASKSWYSPNPNVTTTQIHSMFNSVERTNYQKIIGLERRKGWIK